MKKLIIILIFLSSGLSLYPQIIAEKSNEAGEELLRKAEAEYAGGLYLECIRRLEGFLKNTELRKTEKVKALELAAKAYVETGDIDKADSYIGLMLVIFPHYELKEQENPEMFNRLVRKFKIHPAISIGVRNTANWMNYKTTGIFSFNGLSNSAPYEKELQGIINGFGFMYYGWGEIEFNNGISLNGDLIFKWTNFTRYMASAPPYDLTYREQDNYMEIPVYVKKYFKLTKNVTTYVTAGAGWLHMLKANGSPYIYYPAADSASSTGYQSVLAMRNINTFEWLAGAGIGYKYRNLRMFFDARYYSGFSSITNPGKSTENTVLVEDYFYVDNYVRLKQFELGVSISYTLFNSVKKGKN